MNKKFTISLILLLLIGGGTYFYNTSLTKKPTKIRYITDNEIIKHHKVPLLTVKVIKMYPHNKKSYTQGLLYNDGFLYESTGEYNYSKLLKTQLKTGKILMEHALEPHHFGEGLALWKKNLYQLTYDSHVGFIYDKKTFTLKKEFLLDRQGWGLTTDGKYFIMSNGSPRLYFMNPKTMSDVRHITVTDSIGKVRRINEMEYIHGKIYANIWLTNLIAIISPKTGKVESWIDLRSINPDPKHYKTPYVLNGITYYPNDDALLVTGKTWPYVFEVKVNDVNHS